MTGRQATAREVRTGDVIQTRWSRIHDPRLSLTVDYPTFDLFLSPGVGVIERVRFTGVDNYGQEHRLGFGCGPDDIVWVIDEAPRAGLTFGALGWGYLDRDGRDDDWLDDEWTGDAA